MPAKAHFFFVTISATRPLPGREDQEQNENFLLLIYIKDQDIKKDLIVVEDKIKHETREYNRGQIFKFGDELTDSMVEYLERMRERTKKAS